MEHNLCVLIDFENIAAGAEKEGLGRFKLELVIRRLKDKGRILVARAYGDWGRFAKFKQDLLRLGITLMELTSYRGQEKNRADIALVVDAMELAYTRQHLDTFVVLSGDSDFTPLIMRLKELNKRVLGVGTRRSTSALLKDACDEFIFYDTLVKEQSEIFPMPRRQPEPREPEPEEEEGEVGAAEDETVSSLTKEEAFALIVETLKGLQHDSPGAVSAGLVKASILRKEPAFNETEYGFSTFTRMLEAAVAKGLLVLHRDERAGGVRVEVATEGTAPLPPPPTPAEEEIAELPGLSGEAARLREVLAEAGVDPLPRVYRHTVVYEFADHVQDRMNNKKRNTFLYTVGDVARRCRDTVPPVPPRHVRSVLQALAQSGELQHPDGKPARSPTAPFIIRKDGDGLLDALSNLYLRTLMELGESLSDSLALSQLLYGDDDHAMVVEEMVAWLVHERAHEASQAQEEGADREPRRGREGRPEERRDDRGNGERRDERRDERRRDDRGNGENRRGRDERRDDRGRDARRDDGRRRDDRGRDGRRDDRRRDEHADNRGRRPETAPRPEPREGETVIATVFAPPLVPLPVEPPAPEAREPQRQEPEIAAPIPEVIAPAAPQAGVEQAPAPETTKTPERRSRSRRAAQAEAEAEPLPPEADEPTAEAAEGEPAKRPRRRSRKPKAEVAEG